MFQNLLNLFFPAVCLGCDSILLSNENVICTRCRHEIPLTNHHLILENEVFKKFYGKIDIQFAVAFTYFHKKGIVQELMHKLKYQGHQEIGTVFGDWFSSELNELNTIYPIDVIVPVPIHKRKLKERGYNQVTTFGNALAKNTNLSINEGLLARKLYARTQTQKNLINRIAVTKLSPFEVSYSEIDYGKHFLLIDDVITTGSTLESCCKALLKIPGAKVSIACIALTH